jgi:hypothetical protein
MKTLTNYEDIVALLNSEKAPEEAPKRAGVATDKAQAFYVKQCKLKGVEPMEGYDELTGANLTIQIKEVQKLPNFAPVTDGQIVAIKKRFAKCRMEEPDESLFVGMSITQASSMINKLDDLFQDKWSHIPTPGQIEFVTKIMMCPDTDSSVLYNAPQEVIDTLIDAEAQIELNTAVVNKALNIKQDIILKKVEGNLEDIKKAIADAESVIATYQGVVVECQATIEICKEAFSFENVSFQQCSDYIQKNKATYYKWAKDRASEGQRDLINKLRKRVGDPELDLETLMQFNKNTAGKYITQLESESGPLPSTLNLEKEHEDIDRDLNFPKTLADAEEAFHKNVVGVIHSLCAVMGQHADENGIFESGNFEAEFIDLIQEAYIFTEKGDMIDLLAPVMSKEDVETIIK